MNEGVYTLTEVCKELGISTASGRNWVRLGKLTPDVRDMRGRDTFSENSIKNLVAKLNSTSGKQLKSRRNKKMIQSHAVYSGYLDQETSEEAMKVLSVFLSEDMEIKQVLAVVSTELLLQVMGLTENRICGDKAKEQSFDYDMPDICQTLVDDLMPGTKERLQIQGVEIQYRRGQDVLGFLYSSLREVRERKLGGAYYTPKHLVDGLINEVKQKTAQHEKMILDPACGSGNFLLQLLQQGYSLECLYGYDIDPVSVQLARINLFLYCCSEGELKEEQRQVDLLNQINQHVLCKNFLSSEEINTYDLIIGNPPWGGESGLKEKDDICDLFIKKSIHTLVPGGHLAFLVPEAVFYVKSHKQVQQMMANQLTFSYFRFLGGQFPGVICPALMFTAEKKGYERNREEAAKMCRIKQADGQEYLVNSKRIFERNEYTFRLTEEDYSILRHMETGEKVYLKNNADFALGIVTGDNGEKLKTQKQKKDWEPVITGKEIQAYTVAKPKYYIRYRPEELQQTAQEEYYRAVGKLVYRFISDAPVVAYDDKQRLTLNSCNILIPHITGLDTKYIMAVLNSESVRFYYRKRFGSMKILRSHLEAIPIPVPTKKEQDTVVGLVNQILDNSEQGHGEKENSDVKKSIISSINQIIAELFR